MAATYVPPPPLPPSSSSPTSSSDYTPLEKEEFVKKIIHLHSDVVAGGPNSNEVLYGRAGTSTPDFPFSLPFLLLSHFLGYLLALVKVYQVLGEAAVKKTKLEEIADAVMTDGFSLGNADVSPPSSTRFPFLFALLPLRCSMQSLLCVHDSVL